MRMESIAATAGVSHQQTARTVQSIRISVPSPVPSNIDQVFSSSHYSALNNNNNNNDNIFSELSNKIQIAKSKSHNMLLSDNRHQLSGHYRLSDSTSLPQPTTNSSDNFRQFDYFNKINSYDSIMPNHSQAQSRKQSLVALNKTYCSFNSDVSRCSSISSVESLLEQRRENPEEILLALGFGGAICEPNPNTLMRVPSRFFEQHSHAKGVHLNEIIQSSAQQHPSNQLFQRPLDPAESNKCSVGHASASKPTLVPSNSILNSINREFYLNQGKEDDNLLSVKQPKYLVMGSKTYRFDCEDSDLYSPKTSQICESELGPATYSPSPQPPVSPNPSLNNLDECCKGSFLSMPISYSYRKLSCPNIDFNQPNQSIQSQGSAKLNDYVSQVQANSMQSNSAENIAHQHRAGHLSNASSEIHSAFTLNSSEFIDQIPKLNLTTICADLIANSNPNMSYFIEAALITSIQSLKLSLDFYRYFMIINKGCSLLDNVDCANQSQMTATGHDPLPDNNNNNPSIGQDKLNKSQQLKVDKQRLTLQNLYMDVLDVETMLYDCLAKFKHSSNWPLSTSSYIGLLKKTVDKISQIQSSLQRINSSSSYFSSSSSSSSSSSTT